MIKIEKTESQRLRVNNSTENDSTYYIAASINIENGVPTNLMSGTVLKDTKQVASFNRTLYDFNITFINSDKENRMSIFNAVEDFIEKAFNKDNYETI